MKTLTAAMLLDYLLGLADHTDLTLIPIMFREGDVCVQAQTQHLTRLNPQTEIDYSALTFVTQCDDVIVIGSIPEVD